MVMTPACRVRVDGRKRRFSKPLISYVICYKNYACSVRDVIVFMWTDESDSNTLRLNAYFLKTEKISVFKKSEDTC